MQVHKLIYGGTMEDRIDEPIETGRALAEACGGYGERVGRPEDIRSALERAAASGVPSCINVAADSEVKTVTQAWSAYRAGTMGVRQD